MHAFKAHLLAATCAELGVTSAPDDVPHETSHQWLEIKARSICENRVLPCESKDSTYGLHRSFLHVAFMYTDLQKKKKDLN